jgi:hypothetical protein
MTNAFTANWALTLSLLASLFVSPLSSVFARTGSPSLENHQYYQKVLKILSGSKNENLKEALYEATKGQRVLSYKEARRELFGSIYLEKSGSRYFVEDTYCEEEFTSSVGVGPGRIPNHNEINCEHTWPQSRFTSRMSKSAQKSDLHHLFPVKSVANSTRGNFPFAEVHGDDVHNCPASQRGDDIYSNNSAFEPPKAHKGNTARALFYFSVRYKIALPNNEEVHLRKWHRLDPVDSDERARHEKIFSIQGNRNPFIDDPDIIDRIEDL